MGCANIIGGLKGELTRVVKSMRTTWLNDKNAWTTKTLGPLEQYAAEEATIDLNESLTQQGKGDQKRTLATKETVPQLKHIRKDIEDAQAKDQGYREQFFTLDAGIKDEVPRLLQFSYIWGALDRLDQSERISRFTQAAERDDVLVMAAMLENPFGPMVTEDVRARALTERAKRVFAQQYENFEQNQILLEYMTAMRDWIGRWVCVEVGVDIAVIRTNLGDQIADQLTAQIQTGVAAAVK